MSVVCETVPMHPLVRTAAVVAGAGLAGLGYAAGIERNAFTASAMLSSPACPQARSR